MYELCVTSSFSAAHFLREYEGKCEQMHGHNWDVAVYVSGKTLNKSGMVIDFKNIKTPLSHILQNLDHTVLNDLDYFRTTNPSCENIARYIFTELRSMLNKEPVPVSRVTVWETKNASVTYTEET